MRYLLGVDDTDDVDSRGTGHRVRQLAASLQSDGIAEPLGITRHQLLVSPEIRYTSHNSSACLVLEADDAANLWNGARTFLRRESAPGSDVGLCLADWERIDSRVLSFGRRAKAEVLKMREAEQVARDSDMECEGLTGTGEGIIGALASVGLHRDGNDGRFLWLPGLRELKGKLSTSDIRALGHVDLICKTDGTPVPSDVFVEVGEWVRPVLLAGEAALYVEEKNNEWYVLSKDSIKALSD